MNYISNTNYDTTKRAETMLRAGFKRSVILAECNITMAKYSSLKESLNLSSDDILSIGANTINDFKRRRIRVHATVAVQAYFTYKELVRGRTGDSFDKVLAAIEAYKEYLNWVNNNPHLGDAINIALLWKVIKGTETNVYPVSRCECNKSIIITFNDTGANDPQCICKAITQIEAKEKAACGTLATASKTYIARVGTRLA